MFSRIPCERLVRHVLLATSTGKQPRSIQRTRYSDCVTDLAWSCLRVKPGELSEIAVYPEAF